MSRDSALAAVLLFLILAVIIEVALLYSPPVASETPQPTPTPTQASDTPSFGYIPQPTPTPSPQPTTTPIQTPDYLVLTPATLDWGNVTRPVTRTVNVTSTAPCNLTLTMTYTCPVATLTWNLENTTIMPHETRNATFTLAPNWNATQGPFTCQITVTGTQQT